MSLDLLLAYAASGATGGIATARPYIESMAKSFSAAEFERAIKEAGDRLTHSGRDLVVKSFASDASASGWDSDAPEGSILVYDAVLSTKDKDRDGDIIHPEGMRLETKMPLLWQHMASEPIGVMVKNLEQNADEVINRYAIADTELGRDAATLTKMGALRKSHGFFPMPGRFQPIDIVTKADGSRHATGFEIFELSVYESSLVSIPAGAKAVVLRTYEKEFDAICTAHSRDLLSSACVKSWAEGIYDARQKVFSGARAEDAKLVKGVGELQASPLEAATPSVVVNLSVGEELCNRLQKFTSNLRGVKSFAESLSVKMMGSPDYMPGSFEDVQSSLNSQAERYLERNVDGFSCDYAYVTATFTDSAVVCCWTYDRETYEYKKPRCYRIAWAYDDDGNAKFNGEPQAVEIAVSVVEKSLQTSRIDWKEPPSRKDAGDPVQNSVTLPADQQSDADPILALFESF